MSEADFYLHSLLQLVNVVQSSRRSPTRRAENVTPKSDAQQRSSRGDRLYEASRFSSARQHETPELADTVLYLGYGSNLSAETFLGKRGIKPLSQVNVVVPALSLTFDLPGFAYSEPCFGNVRFRDARFEEKNLSQTEDYHKDRWPKGLVGVVYEVTKEDYIHIIATEGGGSGYQDVLVDCYTLSLDPHELVPLMPTGQSFKAHTLCSPPVRLRNDPSYAQPSARYLKLITDGASEHALPYEYQEYLNQIRTYRITTVRQRLGQFIFLCIWSPFLLFLVTGAGVFLKPDGTYPTWLAKLIAAIFTASWASYDGFFKHVFGDGERTIGDGKDESINGDNATREKRPLIGKCNPEYGTADSSTENIV